jgi:hypothetical protein
VDELDVLQQMKTIDDTQESPTAPSVLAILAGGGAVAWMLYLNGFEMFRHWFFYPSFLFFVLTCASLLTGITSRFSRTTWTVCMWWSGLWTLVFVAAFAAPPFSTFIVGYLVAPILEVGRIGPFSAGFLHLLIWACAKDVVKHIKTEEAEQVGASDGDMPTN